MTRQYLCRVIWWVSPSHSTPDLYPEMLKESRNQVRCSKHIPLTRVIDLSLLGACWHMTCGMVGLSLPCGAFQAKSVPRLMGIPRNALRFTPIIHQISEVIQSSLCTPMPNGWTCQYMPYFHPGLLLPIEEEKLVSSKSMKIARLGTGLKFVQLK